MFELLGALAFWAFANKVEKIEERNRPRRELEERRRRAELEERKRKTTQFHFDYRVTYEDFKRIVRKAINECGHRNRIIDVFIHDACITLRIESQSGLSDWNCEIDFNDYGRYTGKYYISQENEDSTIPDKIAKIINKKIEQNMKAHHYTSGFMDEDESERRGNSFFDSSTWQTTEDKGFYFCSKCGSKLTDRNAKFCYKCGKMIK